MFILSTIISLLFTQPLHHTLSVAPTAHVEHYGTEEGLPQNTVMSILQDKKGYIWFSTWNGLSKFDGYKFSNFKLNQEDNNRILSNRMDFTCEDSLGYIWVLSYDNEAHRFDPNREVFVSLSALPELKEESYKIAKMVAQPSGKMWLLTKDQGAICVQGEQMVVKVYSKDGGEVGSNVVNTVLEDETGSSWLLTKRGLYGFDQAGKPTVAEFDFSFTSAIELEKEIWFGHKEGVVAYNKNNGHFKELELTNGVGVQEIKKQHDQQILIVLDGSEFMIYDQLTGKAKKYSASASHPLGRADILGTHVDKRGNVWIELEHLGVTRFDRKREIIEYFLVESESPIVQVTAPIFFVLEDDDGNLWVHPRGGGFSYYDEAERGLKPFYNDPSSNDWHFSNLLHSGIIDRQGNLWLGTHSNGLDKVVLFSDVFEKIEISPYRSGAVDNLVRAVFEDRDGNLWVSTKRGRVHLYDENKPRLEYLSYDGSLVRSGRALAGITYCMFEDSGGDLWLGTKGEGIYRLRKRAEGRYDVENYCNNPLDEHSLSSDNVYSIFEDSRGSIWIGTYGGGVNLMDSETDGRFYNHKNMFKEYPMEYGSQVRVVSEDGVGNICVGTTFGMIIFRLDTDQKILSLNPIEYKHYTNKSEQGALSANDVYDIITTSKGETYLATFGGGVNKIAERDHDGFPTRFDAYTVQDGLLSDISLSIVEDFGGNLWVASEENISMIDLVNKTVRTYSDISRLLEGASLSEGAKCVTREGMIYFGSSKGVLLIDPYRLEENTFKPYLALTRFQIANENMIPGGESPLKYSIDNVEKIKLSHKQNFFNIEFAALDYIEPRQIIYAYMLEGFDKDWIVTQEQRVATYNNLSSGEYVFRVRSTNSDGIWMENEHRVEIELVPSFWLTKWAIFIYIVVGVILLWLVSRSLFKYYRMRDRVELEHEQNEMRTRFFMDISHEIRTPLTMIVSPIENLLNGEHTVEETKSQLKLVQKNANRMLHLVNQILDFRKIQKTKLALTKVRVGELVEEISTSFARSAQISSVDLNVTNGAPDQEVWVDKEGVEKMVFNLLSNALKHTPKGKRIDVIIYKRGNALALEVKDQGSGIPKEIQNRLFKRFVSFSTDKSKPSTGLGLSIVKEIADKHHAEIEVESMIGQGSVFTVLFPLGMKHFDENEVEFVTPAERVESSDIRVEVAPPIAEVANRVREKELILIVEDDDDLREYIVGLLKKEYLLLEAPDGEVGLELAQKHLPDFILSDIMMPKMDGIEFLRRVRDNEATSHTPFILLTAKTDVESQLEGLGLGADDYITKPFSVSILKARIENIIRRRRVLYQGVIGEPVGVVGVECIEEVKADAESGGNYRLSRGDEEFIKRVKEVIEENIDNSDFMVDDLVSEMVMSRTVFFKKIKSFTGLAPIEYIREVKIRYAAHMLVSEDYAVKEVAFMIGISDTKYFSRWFKTIMGVTPSEYRKRT